MPEQIATPEEAAALVVALAQERGLAVPSEIEDQAAALLSLFALDWPDHPVARYFDRADAVQIEAFFRAVARQLRPARREPHLYRIALYLN